MHLRSAIALPAATSLLAASVLVFPVDAQTLQTPTQVFGHEIGADRKLVRWDGIVRYMQMADQASDRVTLREVGKSSHDRPFLVLEISSPETLRDIDRYKALQRRLYFQDHVPGGDPDAVHTAAQREELFSRHKTVVLITCSIHATEVGAAQMTLELVYNLATATDERTRKILDNVIFLLVPSLNPDGQDMVAEWYGRYVGTEYEAGNIPWLYHPYVGHDNNRDMYMLTQAETRNIAQVLYKDWFPSIWLDEHQMGSTGPRIFTMPATDPINLNVHPLIYRLNGVYGQAQAAALEAAGKTGIIYDYTYTNFWPGAMAWTGWWHNQVGMLTEVASVRIATPTYQQTARMGETPRGPAPSFGAFEGQGPDDTLPPPRDAQPRTNYPRPWLGGIWRLRDIVEYELVATMALLETAADTRRTLLEQLYEVNRTAIRQFGDGQRRTATDGGNGSARSAARATGRVMEGSGAANGTPYAVIVDPEQTNPVDAARLLQLLETNGVIVERSAAAFTAGGRQYATGTWVIRLGQVFGAYAKEMLETQVYPEVRLSPESPPRPPYDVTAWSLGLLMGVGTRFVESPFDASLDVVRTVTLPRGRITGSGGTYLIDASYNDGFTAANRLWASGARIRRARTAFSAAGTARFGAGTWVVEGVSAQRMREIAEPLGLTVQSIGSVPSAASAGTAKAAAPRIALYQPWGSNMDEGWTRWVLEHYGFEYTTLHPQDLRAAAPNASGDFEIPVEERARWPGHVKDHTPSRVVKQPLAGRFDVILFADQGAESILRGSNARTTPPTYRGGVGEDGLAALKAFVERGGTIVTLGSAGDLLIAHWPIPVKNVAATLADDELLIPGSIVQLEADPIQPLTWGMPETTHGFFIRSPFYALTDGFSSQRVSVPLRYPNTDVRASGWIRGGEHLQGRAAAVQVDFAGGGRVVLIGIRPQHRAQTHATFKLLFNALVNAGP